MIPLTRFKFWPFRSRIVWFVVVGSIPVLASATEYAYPPDSGVLDVTAAPWNVDNTGATDVTAVLQQIIDETIPRKFGSPPEVPDIYWPTIIYFPNGTYRISDSLVGAILNQRQAIGGIVLQGQSRDGVVLRLDDNAAGFGDPNTARYVLDYFAGDATNNAFVNSLENITIDVGAGNPGAVGLRFHANNVGAIRNVRITTSDPAGAGHTGLEFTKHTQGPWLVRDLEVEGFRTGIRVGTANRGRHMVTILGLRLWGQTMAGIEMVHFTTNIHDAESVNDVPFMRVARRDSMVNLINANLRTLSGGVSAGAIQLDDDNYIYLRDVESAGYGALVRRGTEVVRSGAVGDEGWQSGTTLKLFEDSPEAGLALPIEVPPDVPWDAVEDWAIVSPLGGGLDDTANVRAAMNSGKSTVFFTRGTYRISRTIDIPPTVRRVAGQHVWINTQSSLGGSSDPLFRLGPSNHPVVLVERFNGNFQNHTSPFILNGHTGTLVIRDIFWVRGAGYRSEPTAGRVFIENFHTLPGSQNNPQAVPAFHFRGQNVWAYQWNPEQLFPHALVEGGQFVAFGFKTGETRGPIAEVYNHARVELIGGVQNTTHATLDTANIAPEETRLFHIDEANLSARVFENYNPTPPWRERQGGEGWGKHAYVAVEIRNGEERRLANEEPEVPLRADLAGMGGSAIGHFSGAFAQTGGNEAPIVSSLSAVADPADPFRFVLSAVADDPDGFPAAEPRVLWSLVAGPGLASFEQVAGQITGVRFARPGVYRIRATASDGHETSSEEIDVEVAPAAFEKIFDRWQAYRFLSTGDAFTSLNPAFLQVGFELNLQTSSLMIEFPLHRFAGMEAQLKEARLRVRVEALNALQQVRVARQVDGNAGVPRADDFAAGREVFATLSLDGVTAGDWIDIDVTAAVRADIAAGKTYSAIWLEPVGMPDGTATFVRFSSTTAVDSALRPRLSAAFDVDGTWGPGVFHPFRAVDGWVFAHAGPGREDEAWLGWVYVSEYPYVYLHDLSQWAFAVDGQQWFFLVR